MYIHVHMYMYMYIHAYTHVPHVQIRIYTFVHIRIHTYIHTYMYIHVYTSAHMYCEGAAVALDSALITIEYTASYILTYGVALVSRIGKIIRLFCKRAL